MTNLSGEFWQDQYMTLNDQYIQAGILYFSVLPLVITSLKLPDSANKRISFRPESLQLGVHFRGPISCRCSPLDCGSR